MLLQELGLLFLFLSFPLSLSDPVYMVIGGDAVLRPATMDLLIKNIEWKHNGDIAADWFGYVVVCFGQFEGRCEVNADTGELIIKGQNLNDSGIYTPEINYKVFSTIDLSVISRVAKPSVKTSCNNEMTNCLLTCEGNTADAKPIISKWFIDGRDGPLGDQLIITEDTKENSFSCLMKNPVSNETSESITNPFRPDPVYMVIGGDAVLRPATIDAPIRIIEWKYNEDIAADWFGYEVVCFGQFKGRCEINTDTGELIIKELNLNDSGIYTPEINGKVFNKIHLSVISRVAKPSVKTSCNTEMTSCLLTCEGNTAETEPITYTWFIDGQHGPSDKHFTITKDLKEKSFRCLMKNPVSSETSESITNPIIIKRDWLIPILVPVIVVVAVIVVAAFFIYKYIRGKKQRSKLEKEIKDAKKQIRELEDEANMIEQLKDEATMKKQLKDKATIKGQLKVTAKLKALRPATVHGWMVKLQRALLEKLEGEKHEKMQQIRERKNQQRRANTKRRRKEQEDAKKRIKELEGMLQKKQARIWQQKRAHAEKLIKELEETDAMEEDDERRQTALYTKLQRELEVFIFKETKHDMDPLNQPPDGEEAESVTPETSNQSPEEAAASNTDQEAELTSVEVHNPPSPLTSGYQQGL